MLCEVLSKRAEDICDKIDEVYANNFLQTSTWGVNIFENELSIKSVSNKEIEDRRAIISAKWRGAGSLTLEVIKNTVSAYTNADIEVGFGEDGVINIEFISVYGIPKNMEDVYNTIEEIKPAHLGVKYVFRYRTWGDLKGYRWGDLKSVSWGRIKEEEYDERNREL